MTDTAALLRGNAMALPLRDESVDLIVTSPPYFALRSYQDDGEHYDGQLGSEATPRAFLESLWTVMDECWRVLKPSGSVFVNLGDKYAGSGGGNQSGILAHRNPALNDIHDHRVAAFNAPKRYNQCADVRAKSKMLLPHRFALGCIDPDYRTDGGPQWVLRSDIVWSKPNGLPESVTDRVRASHEYLFHLTKSELYYAGIDEIREAHAVAPHAPGNRAPADLIAERIRGAANASKGVSGHLAEPDRLWGNPLGKLPGSVWQIPTEPLSVPDWLGVDHYAAFPTELPRRIILGWTPTGICTTCDEARTAVVERQPMQWRPSPTIAGRTAPDTSRTTMSGTMLAPSSATITGYRCACPDTQAATRPAVVLDPFAGTGTTPMVARALGRYGIGLDLSNDYLRLARWRVFDSGHWDKAVERTTGRKCETPDQIPGQLRLL